jgi:hypothetical protein
MLICKDDCYRTKVGLPSLLPAEPAELAWRHLTFLKFVVEGIPNPLAH